MSFNFLEILLILISTLFITSFLWRRKKKQNKKNKFLDLLNIKNIDELEDNDRIFPWEHVIGCDILTFDEQKIEIYFRSPPSTWKNLAGRAGPLTICRKTKKQIDFICEVMN